MEFIEDPDGALVTYADVAALRDTGPRPDSGIDALVAAVFAFMDERVDEPHEMTPAEERLMKASREYARLSTPKTSEQKPAGWSTGEPWNPDGAQP
jgi:hypothetical protein